MKKYILALLLITSSLISAELTNLKTISSNFTQLISNSSHNTIKYNGKMYAKKENNLALWIYTSPVEKKIYYRDGNIVILEPDLEQVTFAKLNKVPNIISILKRAKKISKNKLVATFNKTKYTITTNKNTVKKIQYKDEMQNRVTINFYNTKVNHNISDRVFIYEIPAGYDVLKQ